MLTRAWKVLSGYVVILVKWTGAREYRSAVSYAAAKSLAVREVFVNPHVYRHAWLMERDPYRSGGGG